MCGCWSDGDSDSEGGMEGAAVRQIMAALCNPHRMNRTNVIGAEMH